MSPIPRLHKETSLFNRTKTLSASFKVLADSITSLVEGKETYTDPDGKTVTNTFGTVLKQTANNVLIKATESSKTASEGGAALITSLINVATAGVKIAAAKVDIEGAAIFTGAGRLSQQSLNNTYDAKGTANTATKRSQRIYYRSSVGSAPNAMPTAWVTATGNKYNSTQSSASGWTTKVPPIASDTGENVSKYPYLWTCEQREQLDGNLAYTNVLLDESSTVIDGGRLITGSVTANSLNARNINSSGILTVGSFTNEASASILNSNVESAASARSQTIYKSSAKGTTTMAANTTWVTASGDTQNVWTTTRPTYSQDYPVLFVATQSQTVAQKSTTTCSCTTPVIDKTTTVIDGGSIITNSITADQLDANRINLSGILTIGALTPSTKSDVLNSNAISSIKDSMSGFTILWNYSNYTYPDAGEAYICAYDPLTNATSNENGWVTFNGTKRTITKQMANPNNILPYNVPIYIVCRLSSASATSGTNYMVWYDSGWKYAAMPTPSAVGGSWTWNNATDIILGKFVEPSNEGQLTECFVFNPPLTSKHVSTDTTTAASANSAASAAQSTANSANTNAASAQSTANSTIKSSIQLWFTKDNSTAPSAPTAHVTTNDASTANKWNIAVPTYNAAYPHYFYCYEYLKGNNTYSWSPVVYDRATTESQSTVRATSSSLANYITNNNSVVESLQEQIDSSIDIWYGTSEPTSSTAPWPSDDNKDLHVGDMYVNTANGHNFRYTKSGSTYSWTQIPNSDASAALTAANSAQTTADGKRTVFTATPTVPYDVGDLWVNGSVVKYSKTKRTSSESYTASDWVLTATDDTKANAAQTTANANIRSSVQLWYTKENSTAPSKPTAHVTTNSASTYGQWNMAVPTYNESYKYYFYCYEYLKADGTYDWSPVVYDRATTESQSTVQATSSSLANYIRTNDKALSSLQSQVDGSVDIWYGSIDPTSSTAPWPSDDSKDIHVGDMYVNTATGKSFRYTKSGSTYAWTEIPDEAARAALSAAGSAKETADKKRRVFTVTPTVPYDVGDLWVSGTTIQYAKTARTTGSYSASDWALTATDDTAASAAKSAAENAASAASSAQTTADNANNKLVSFRGICTTPTGTAAKTVACAGFALTQGYSITVYNATAQTVSGAITLNVNSLGAKAVWVANAATSDTNRLYWSAGSTVTFVYDGTNFRVADNPGSYLGSTCSVAENNGSKVTSVGDCVIFKGTAVSVPMTYANTATSPTLNVSSTSARNIYYGTSTTVPTKENGFSWLPDTNVIFVFDGKFWKTGNQTFTDGKNLIIGSVSADKLNANDINAKNLLTIGALSTSTQDSILNSNITIGGRNVLLNSDTPSKFLKNTPNEYEVARLQIASGQGFVTDQWYTLQIWGYNYNRKSINAYVGGGNYNVASWMEMSSNGDMYAVFTFKATASMTSASQNIYIYASNNIGTQGSTTISGSFTVTKAKLECGNKPTDWTPAPEDVSADSVKRTQRIYYRSNVNTKPTAMPTAWVTETGNKYNTNATTASGWSTKVTPVSSSVDSSTKYIYLWTCEQREMADGTIAYTNVLLDDSMTVIDGGNIATGTITANKLNVNDINAKKSLTIGAFTDGAQRTISDAAKTATNYITYMNQTDGIKVSYNGTNAATQITSDGVDIINSSNVSVAKFGENVRIGKANWSRLEMDYHSMQLVDYAGNTYFHVSDLRDESGFATITETFKGDGSTNLFYVMYSAQYTVSVTDSSHSNVTYTYQDLASGDRYLLSETPSSGATVTIVYKTSATTTKALTFGSRSGTVGPGSVALGFYVEASGSYSTAVGSHTRAEGNYSYAEGDRCRATGETTHSEGRLTKAEGDYSHAEGINTIARGRYSHAEGAGTWAYGDSQHTCGKYNVTDTTSLLIVGKGKDSSRSNAMKLGSDGALWIAGSLTQNSDRRLKTHHAYLGKEASTFMRKLRPALFTKDGERHLGFYAQDIQAAEPENWDTVTVKPEHTDESLDFDPLTLDYTALIAPLTAYAQQLEKRVEYLESTVDSLVEANDELREMVDNLIGERL